LEEAIDLSRDRQILDVVQVTLLDGDICFKRVFSNLWHPFVSLNISLVLAVLADGYTCIGGSTLGMTLLRAPLDTLSMTFIFNAAIVRKCVGAEDVIK
jgi:hypothetical protein